MWYINLKLDFKQMNMPFSRLCISIIVVVVLMMKLLFSILGYSSVVDI